MVQTIASTLLIWPSLEAREEILAIFCCFFGKFEDTTNLFWNYLTFRWIIWIQFVSSAAITNLTEFEKIVTFNCLKTDKLITWWFDNISSFFSVRVVPRDDPGRWLIREPTADIFDHQSIVISETAGPDTFARQPFQVILVMYSFLEKKQLNELKY